MGKDERILDENVGKLRIDFEDGTGGTRWELNTVFNNLKKAGGEVGTYTWRCGCGCGCSTTDGGVVDPDAFRFGGGSARLQQQKSLSPSLERSLNKCESVKSCSGSFL